MKYLDEFREPVAAKALVEQIRRTATRPWTIMEVCGGQTHSIIRNGIDQLLDKARSDVNLQELLALTTPG